MTLPSKMRKKKHAVRGKTKIPHVAGSRETEMRKKEETHLLNFLGGKRDNCGQKGSGTDLCFHLDFDL